MIEREKSQRAKEYIDSLANGVNPLDGSLIPEQEVVNQVRISRCLFYVSDVLRRQIEESEPQSVRKSEKLFYITEEEKRQTACCTSPEKQI